MARKKQQNIIRTDYLENWMGFYIAHGYKAKSDVLNKIARDIGAPIDYEEVERMYELHKTTQLELFTGYDMQEATPV